MQQWCKLAFAWIIMTALALSCKKNDQPPTELSAVNKWILDSMRVYYYWADNIKKVQNDDADATDFFRSLLNSSDRFSYLDDPAHPPAPTTSYGYYGFLYAITETSLPDYPSLAMVTMTVPTGPADRQGLKRGDVLLTVNSLSFNTQNAEKIKAILSRGEALDMQVGNISANGINNIRKLSLTAGYYDAPPVFTTRVFSGSGKKTGYIYYDEFNGVYDQSTLDSVAKFKQAGITDLIIDLRYNPGGDVASVAKMGAAVAHINRDQVFLISQANKNGGRIIDTFEQSISKSGFLPVSFSSIITHQLNIDKLYVLTTSATASSAELLINNLKPYINVVQVGGQTLGKDMASFAISDQRQPRQTDIVLHPLIFKLYNANNKGDYPQGLPPDHPVNEFSELPLKPFGDPDDPLIHKALELSLGNTQVAVSAKPRILNVTYPAATPVYLSSGERSRRSVPMLLPSRTASFQKK